MYVENDGLWFYVLSLCNILSSKCTPKASVTRINREFSDNIWEHYMEHYLIDDEYSWKQMVSV